MSSEDDEARLRAEIADAHRGDAERTPRFEAMWAAGRARPSRSRWRWVPLTAGLAAAAAGVVLFARLRASDDRRDAQWPIPGTRWTGPTDFLLETPDLITLRSLPPLDPAADPWMARPESRGNP